MVAPAYVLRCFIVTITAASLTFVASGCSRPLTVDAPAVTPECDQILASTPIRLLDQLQRQTSPADVAAVAWGDPPIVLVCGISSSPVPDAQVITIDGVDWITEESDAGTIFTTAPTAARTDATNPNPTLQLRVPAHYRPEVNAVVELTSKFATQIPVR